MEEKAARPAPLAPLSRRWCFLCSSPAADCWPAAWLPGSLATLDYRHSENDVSSTLADSPDCCVALGSELRGDDGGLPPADWRLWLCKSSLVSDNTWLALRFLLAGLMDGVLAWSIVTQTRPPAKWLIYLTHWTLLPVCLHLSLGAAGAVTARHSLSRHAAAPQRPWWLRLHFFAQAVALPNSLIVVVLFWALLYPATPSVARDPLNYFVHGVNFLCMALDALLSSSPFPAAYLLPAWLCFDVAYVFFTLAYALLGGTNEYGQPWVYSVLFWRSQSGALSAGFLCGVIVLLVFPAVALQAYCCVFARRRRLQREPFALAAPACFPPQDGPRLIALPYLRRYPLLRFLPLLAALLLSCGLAAATSLATTLHQRSGYWQTRERLQGSVIPFISDMAVNLPQYWVFACCLTAAGAVLLAALRMLYEGMDAGLAAVDAREGRFVYALPLRKEEEMRHWPAAHEPPAVQAFASDEPSLATAPLPVSRVARCWRSPRWRYCCFCCSQGFRGQAHSAYVCAVLFCLSLPLVSWCSAGLDIEVHGLAAAVLFVCAYFHIFLFARITAARARLSRERGAAQSARLKAALLLSVPLLLLPGTGVTLLASGRHWAAIWGNELSPMLEWAYAGVMGLYTLSLIHELGSLVREGSDDHR